MKNKIVILGAGESGVGAALLAQQQGHKVFVSDGDSINPVYKDELILRRIDFEEGTHTEEKIFDADVIVKSPGISDKNKIVQELIKRGTEIISEIEFAFRYKGESKILAVTGSNRKNNILQQ